MNTILKVDDINVYYGAIHAIKGVSFEVNEGEVVTLIGASPPTRSYPWAWPWSRRDGRFSCR